VGRLFGTAAAGDFNYFSIGTANDLVGPLFWYIDGALRLTIGFARGEIPAQANWYLGGVKTVRGYAANSASGEVAYILRTEIGTSLPLLRLVLFADVGWASDPGDLLESDPLIGVGPGLSFFDGVVRIDFATGLNRNGAFRVSFATSGLF
jgi:hemolysin activation/secretion protein